MPYPHVQLILYGTSASTVDAGMTYPRRWAWPTRFNPATRPIGPGRIVLDGQRRFLVTGSRPAYTFTRADPLGSVTSARQRQRALTGHRQR